MPTKFNKKDHLEQNRKKIAGGLYIVSTPIGNLGDMTIRGREILEQADIIACEDTRVTGKLLARFQIKSPTISYHDHNEQKVLPQLLDRLAEGQIVALVSDAGTPLISDPGYRLVKEAADAGHMVCPIPGASAILAALATAGLPTDRFMFAGFLPGKTQARQKILKELSGVKTTLVFYESAKRLKDSLRDILDILGDRQAAVCRELTKLFEEIRRGSLAGLVAHYDQADRPKGEIVVVIGPPEEVEVTADQLDEALSHALAHLSVKEAVASVTYTLGLKRKQVYARALNISGKG
ncbi:16S rRNA (cytidine(1402)-2'-O)-methyltransferase [hydrothermal vent metagenome]|uniref:16S rRNA (Cytidine(1402)-2'-O)-methyltransferase n=1 Tax=hydrothermal vent metagenome TaxID=652676 RepID=A0A3B0RPF9_9ZZZZ